MRARQSRVPARLHGLLSILGPRIDAAQSLIGTRPSQMARRPDWMLLHARSSLSSDVLGPSRFLSRKNFVAFTIEDPQSDRLGRPLYVCGGDDGGGRVSHLDLFLRQIRRAVVGRPANKLDPEYPRLFRNDFGRRIRLRKRRTRGVKPDTPRRPAGDDQGDPSPVSRRLITIGLTFPSPRLGIGLVAKLIHEGARAGAYALDPFQLPKQPRKHIRPLGLDDGARLAMRALATARRLPNGLRDIRPIALR